MENQRMTPDRFLALSVERFWRSTPLRAFLAGFGWAQIRVEPVEPLPYLVVRTAKDSWAAVAKDIWWTIRQ